MPSTSPPSSCRVISWTGSRCRPLRSLPIRRCSPRSATIMASNACSSARSAGSAGAATCFWRCRPRDVPRTCSRHCGRRARSAWSPSASPGPARTRCADIATTFCARPPRRPRSFNRSISSPRTPFAASSSANCSAVPEPEPMPGLSSAALRTAEFRRILLIKFSALGDVVHSIPVVNKLRRRYPSAEIDWLLRPAFVELIARHPAVSHAIPFPRRRWAGPWRGQGPPLASLARLLSRLRSRHYDLVVDLQGQLRSAILTLATGAGVRIGFDRPRPEIRRRSERELPAEAWKHCWQGAREGAWLAYSHHLALPTIDLHAVDRYIL